MIMKMFYQNKLSKEYVNYWYEIFLYHIIGKTMTTELKGILLVESPFLYNVKSGFSASRLFFSVVQKRLSLRESFFGVCLLPAWQASKGRGNWEELLLISLQNRRYIFAFFRRERASTRRAWLECETGMTGKAWENCCPACRVLHARLALFISCLKMQRYNTCSAGCHPLTCYNHRGQTSKSLFLFFIAGISFTSYRKMGKDV